VNIFPISHEVLEDDRFLGAAYRDIDQTHYWSDCWDPDFYVDLARAGFISISATDPEIGTVLVPELQSHYAVLDWDRLHVEGKVARILASGRLAEEQIELAIVDSVAPVLLRLLDYHGESTWLSQPYCELLGRLPTQKGGDFRLRAVELWSRREDKMIAGELGYTIGRTYTSLSGFCERSDSRWTSFGTLQMVLLARRLEAQGYSFWNLGHPHLPYKRALGAEVVPRPQFIERWLEATGETTEFEL
jgi:hypothetical protein